MDGASHVPHTQLGPIGSHGMTSELSSGGGFYQGLFSIPRYLSSTRHNTIIGTKVGTVRCSMLPTS